MVLNVAFACLAASLILSIYRVVRGPSWADRIMALDFLAVNVAVLIVLIALRSGATAFLDAALIVAILGFLSTAALASYLLDGKVMR